jgi:signal transduction histidine kinase
MQGRSFTRFWIIIAIAALLVAVIITAWFISLANTDQEVISQYNQQQLVLVEGTAGSIEAFFDDLAAGLAAMGSDPALQTPEEQTTRDVLARRLDEMSPQGILDLGLLDAAGTAQFFANDTALEGVDFSWRGYFKEAEALDPDSGTAPLLVELQPVSLGELGFVIANPLYDATIGQSFAGVVIGTLSIETLVERYIAPFKPPGDGQILLINNDLDVVWASDTNFSRLNLLGGAPEAFGRMAAGMGTWGQSQIRGEAYTFLDSESGGEIQLIAFAPIQVGQVRMALAVITPADVVRQTSLANFQSQQVVFLASVLVLLAGVLVGGFVLNLEIGRRFRAEEALRNSEREQAILAERNRLAGDLHDSVTQGLYGIVLHADAALGQLKTGQSDQALDYLNEIKESGQEGLAEMRMLIFELRPPILEEEGLAAALETRLYAVERRAGLKTELRSNLSNRLPDPIAYALYRVAQEALNNCLKHAEASRVQIDLHLESARIELSIADDGRGFNQQTAAGRGEGLAGMRARIEQLDGQFNITTAPNQGTVVKAVLPL